MDARMQRLAELLPEEYRGPGLSESERRAAEEQAETVFPPDLRELLGENLPTGTQFPDWRNEPRQAMRDWREFLVSGIHFDVINAEFWLPEWGERPDAPEDSRTIVAERVAGARFRL
jgi:hypothetical protein